MKYGVGDYFGELALLNNEPRAASVIAITDCKVVSLEGESFKVGFWIILNQNLDI
jgi:cAMP-dependent protein kinase regulator